MHFLRLYCFIDLITHKYQSFPTCIKYANDSERKVAISYSQNFYLTQYSLLFCIVFVKN
jgi:hypothetical protein